MSNAVRRIGPFLTLLLALAHISAVTAQPPALPKKPLVDKYGDPLPAGAVARLGTLRFTHGPTSIKVAISPDGKTVASFGLTLAAKPKPKSASDPELTWEWPTLRLWDRASGKIVRQIAYDYHHAHVLDLRYSPDGKHLAENHGFAVRVMEVAPGKPDGMFYGKTTKAKNQNKEIEGFCFSSDGTRLITWDWDWHIHAWALGQPGKPLRSWASPPVKTEKNVDISLVAAAAAPTGKLLAYSYDKRANNKQGVSVLRIVQADTERTTHQIEMPNLPCRSLVFSNDGRYLASLVEGQTEVVLVDTSAGKILHRLPTEYCQRLAFSPDGKTLAAYGLALSLWDVATGKPLTTVPVHLANSVDFSAVGTSMVTGWHDAFLCWDLASGKQSPAFVGHRLAVSHLELLAADTLASWCGDQVIFWDARSWTEKSSHRPADKLDKLLPTNESATLAVQEDAEGMYSVRELITGKLMKQLATKKKHNSVGFFSMDQTTLALLNLAADPDSFLYFFDTATGKLLHELRILPEWNLNAFTFSEAFTLSADGKWFAVHENGGTVCLFETRTGKQLRRLVKTAKPMTQELKRDLLRFSQDRKYLAVSCWSLKEAKQVHEILVWDCQTGQLATTIPGSAHVQPMKLRAIAFALDSRIIAYCRGFDDVVHIAEVATGKERGTLKGHAGYVNTLAFSPDGKHLATGSDDTTILIWDLNRPLSGEHAFKDTLSPQQLAECWKDLCAVNDAAKADRAIWALVSAPKDSVQFLKQKLAPAPLLPAAKIKQLIADLDRNQLKLRQQAIRELEKFDDRIIPHLNAALAANMLSLEAHLRAQKLLARAATFPAITPELIPQLRALEVLERIGTPEARQFVQTLAGGEVSARFTVEATACLQRLKKQSQGK